MNHDLDQLWERLAEAMDRAGPERESLFLAKLALLLASKIGDPKQVQTLIESALRDLN